MTTRTTPTIIEHLDTGKEIGLVISLSCAEGFGAEFQIYKKFDNSITFLKSTSGQYSNEGDALRKFDEWAQEQS